MTVADLRAGNLWSRSSSWTFHGSPKDSDTMRDVGNQQFIVVPDSHPLPLGSHKAPLPTGDVCSLVWAGPPVREVQF